MLTYLFYARCLVGFRDFLRVIPNPTNRKIGIRQNSILRDIVCQYPIRLYYVSCKPPFRLTKTSLLHRAIPVCIRRLLLFPFFLNVNQVRSLNVIFRYFYICVALVFSELVPFDRLRSSICMQLTAGVVADWNGLWRKIRKANPG